MTRITLRATLALCCAAAAVAAPAALATKGGVPQRPEHPAQPTKATPKVAFVVTGTVAALGTDSFTVTVRRANRHAKTALKGATSVMVKVDAKTKFTRSGKGASAATFADMKQGSRVVVTWSAPRGTDITTIAARRVSFKLPAPTPAP